MSERCIDLNSMAPLPLNVIDLEHSGIHFVLRLLYFNDGQTESSVKENGVTGQFGILYEDSGMRCEFEIDCTISSLIWLGDSLEYSMNKEAVLVNEGTEEHSFLSCTSDEDTYIFTGRFRNKENGYRSGISFEITADKAYAPIPDVTKGIEALTHKIYMIQGHNRYN